ncbi:MAG: hypothetical protein HFG22_16180 [Lachnospiraceae bacterium]|nr:hypothetical protein [Lachnospiraceae bacterium]
MTKRKEDILWIFSLLCAAGIMLVPVAGVFTIQMKSFLAITVCGIMLCAFGIASNMLLGIVLPLLYLLFSIAPGDVVYGGWLGTVPMVTLGTLLLAVILEDCGLLRRIALFCITRSGGTYKGVCYALLCAGFVCSLMTSCCVQYVFAALAYGVCRTMKLKPSPAAAGVMLSAAMGTISANGVIPYPGFIGVLTAGASIPGDVISVSWIEAIWYLWPGALFIVFYLWFMLNVMIEAPEISAREAFEQEYLQLGPMSLKEKKAVAILMIIFLMLLTSGWTGIDTAWPFMLVPWAFFLPGIRIADEKTLKKVDYGMVFLIVAFISIGNVAAHVHLDQLILGWLMGQFEDAGFYKVVAFTFIFGVIMNFLFTPLGYFSAFAGVIGSLFRQMSLPVICGLFIFQYSSDAIIMPYENMAYLVYFSFGMFTIRDLAKLYVWKIPFMLVFISIVMTGWWKVIGLF